MNPVDAWELKRGLLKRKKAGATPIIGESSRVLVITTPGSKVMLADPPEVTPLALSKRSRASKAQSSSSAHPTVIFKGVPEEEAPGSKTCTFDYWKVILVTFKNFIRPVDVEQIVGEGNLYRQRDVILSMIQVSIFYSCQFDNHHSLTYCQVNYLAGMPLYRQFL